MGIKFDPAKPLSVTVDLDSPHYMTFHGLTPGIHTVTISGKSEGEKVHEEKTVSVPAGDIVSIEF